MPSWSYIVIVLVVIIFVLAYKISKKQAEIDSLRVWTRNEILRKEEECAAKIEKRDATSSRLSWFESQIKVRKAELDELYIESNRIKSEISEREAASRKELEALRQEQINLRRDIEILRADRRRLKNAPKDVYFSDNGLPIYWEPSSDKPYGDYTVFVNNQSQIFHKDKYCAPYDACVSHLFIALKFARPCRRCVSSISSYCKIPDWFTRDSD